jgi:nitrite reductase (NADH) large subunit
MQSTKSSSSVKPLLVIVGNGMATGRLLDEIINRTPDKFAITVIGKEPFGSYNRIMLSSVLAGDASIESIIQKPPQWYKDNNINFISDTRVSDVNRTSKQLTLIPNFSENDQYVVSYDQLVFATGSRSAKIPADNQSISGLFNFRDIKDTEQIQSFAQSGSKSQSNNDRNKKAVVIGGGLLGLEAAYGLAISGVQVTLVHRNKWLLNRQLDQVSGTMLQSIMAQKNISFVLGCEVKRFDSLTNQQNESILCGVELTSGEYLEASIAVVATGITPNKELGESADIEVNRAIVVNDFMQTSDSCISAIGECCEHKKATFGLVDPIWVQCKTLAERLCFEKNNAFKNSPVPTKLKVSGVQLFSAGVVESSDETHSFILTDSNASVYRKIIIKDEVIVGVVLFGDVSSGMAYFDMMQNKQRVLHAMPELLLGHEFMTIEEEVTSVAA